MPCTRRAFVSPAGFAAEPYRADTRMMNKRSIAWLHENRIALSAAAALALVSLQVATLRLSPSDVPVRIVLPLTIALAPVTLWAFRERVGVWVMYVGLATNLAVVLANGGLMPIEQSTVVEAIGDGRAAEYAPGEWIAGSKDVLLADGAGRAPALGDAIIVRIGDGGFAASAGDVVIFAGLMMLIAEVSWAWQRGVRVERRSGGSEASPPRAEGSAPTPR